MPRIDDDAAMKRARAQMVELLRNPPRPPNNPNKRIDQALWDAASEADRRRMLRDCGWL